MRNILAVCVIVALTAMNANAIEIWLSDVGTVGGGVSQGVANVSAAAGANSVYVWRRPDAEKTLTNIALNVRSTDDGIIDFTGVTMFNPTLLDIGVVFARYEFKNDSSQGLVPSADGNRMDNISGFTVANTDVIGKGMGSWSVGQGDAYYDAAADAFLIAQLDYNAVGALDSTTDLYLQINENGINHEGESSADAEVVFGAASDPALNGNNDRGVDSLTADATLTIGEGGPIIPEPSTVLLAMLGLVGLGFHGCRKR